MSEPIVVYDGVCLLCSRWIRFLLRHDRAQRYRYAAIQSDHGQHLMREHGLDPASPLSMLLVQNNEGYTDTRAIARVLRGLPQRRWHWLGAVLQTMPARLIDPLYRLVARNRYRLFGRSEQCFMPTPEQRALFLS